MTEDEYKTLAETNAKNNAGKVVMTLTKDGVTHEVTLDMLTYFLAYNEKEGNTAFESNKEYYQVLFGDDVNFWTMQGNSGRTMAEEYKLMVYDTVVYTMILYYEAQAAGLTLTDTRKKAVISTTDTFLAKYNWEERARCGMTDEVIRDNYERIFLADQYKEVITANVKIDEDAVRATVDKENYHLYETSYLYISKSMDDANLVSIAGSQEQRKQLMEMCKDEAEKGKSFADIQKEHANVLTYATRDFVKSNQTTYEPEYVSLAQEMELGEFRLLEFNYGIYLITIDSNTKYYGYDDAVQAAIDTEFAKKANEIFTGIDKDYEIKTTDEWDSIEMGAILKAPKK